MRKIILTSLILFFCYSSKSQKFDGGIIGGVCISQVSGDDLAGFNSLGLVFGGFSNIKTSNKSKLQIEMIYSQKGSGNLNINNIQHSDYLKPYIKMSYFEMPIFYKYLQNKDLEFEIGVATAYLIDGYFKDTYGKIDNSNSSPFTEYDLGISLGINYWLTNNLSLNTRYTNSIIPIGKEDYNLSNIYSNNYVNKGKYNSAINFTIQYNFKK